MDKAKRQPREPERRPPDRWEAAVNAYADKFGEDQVSLFGFCAHYTAEQFENAVKSSNPLPTPRTPDGALS